MIKIKPGVEFETIAPAGFLILQALKRVSEETGVDLTITSGTDGDHSGPFDPHHSGEAYDVRSHDFDRGMKAYIVARLSQELGDKFYCSLEDPETPNEHYHLQRARGIVFGVEDMLAYV